jgi:hypothetical protein
MSRYPPAPVFTANDRNQKNGIVSLVDVFDDFLFPGGTINDLPMPLPHNEAQLPLDDPNGMDDGDDGDYDSNDDSDDGKRTKRARGSKSMTEEQKVERR